MEADGCEEDHKQPDTDPGHICVFKEMAEGLLLCVWCGRRS